MDIFNHITIIYIKTGLLRKLDHFQNYYHTIFKFLLQFLIIIHLHKIIKKITYNILLIILAMLQQDYRFL